MELADPQSPPSPEPADPPDWQSITRDVKCPLCDYNLRGLNDPRCPECGYPFEWAKVLDPDRYRHRYLFEYYPDRNVRSFFLTLFHQLKPRRFWKTLEPAQPTVPRRIVLYWFVYSLTILMPAIVGLILVVRNYRGFFPISSPNLWRDIWNNFTDYGSRPIFMGVALAATFPWLNFLALMVFQQSMRKSHVRPVHVLRCAVYSGDVIFWYAIGTAVAFVLTDFPSHAQSLRHPLMSLFLGEGTLVILMAFALVLMILVNAVRLTAAYQRYMEFDHAFAAVLSSQVIVVLAIIALLAYESSYWQ